MSFDRRSTSRSSSPLLPAVTSLGEVVSPDPQSDGEVEQDQLAFTVEALSRPQLQLFETVFNTGKPLSAYCEDDPLWSLLAAVASPCTNCLKTPISARSFGTATLLVGCATWGIPLDVWRRYDAALHERTSTLLELNMLDEQDEVAADQQELQKFLALQQDEASVAAKRKCARSPLPVAGPSTKKVRLEVSKKRSRRKSPVVEVASEPPRRVLLVVPPGRLSVTATTATTTPAPPRILPSPMEVSVRDDPVQGSSGLVQLATIAEAHSGLVHRRASPPAPQVPIKGGGSDIFSSNMPSTPRSTLVPRVLTAHPYCAENQCLAAQVRLLESQLADSRRENSSLTTALCDTSHALDARQREVEQLRSSSQEFVQNKVEYRRIIDQFLTLDRGLSGSPGQSLLERFKTVEEELRVAKKDRDATAEQLSTSSRKVSELTTTLLYQQGIVDEANALATRQRTHREKLQEEVHRTRGRAAFVEQMIQEYPDEGFYEVVLPPLSQLEGDLVNAQADLRHVATLAHRLFCSDPATVLHHHNRYIGAIIEAVIAFLRRGLDSDDLEVVAHSFRLALDYMQSAQGIHGDLHMRSISSIQWFFHNTVDQDEGLYDLMLEHSRFDNDGPFLTASQHAGFVAPPPNSLEPPLHRRMLALSTALPHREGAGRWDDIVPAIPNVPVPMVVEPDVDSSDAVVERPLEETGPPSPVGSSLQVPLFLSEQESPTSPSPPPPSPGLPPLFGSVTPLSIDLTGDDDELYETGVAPMGPEAREVEASASEGIVKEERL
ncbi:hypothetical protein EV359DRAFT_87553 [Lentinula novae-zelandiae]|nr:hypothetical protein EV359DRAFT_87553 [Lentinula novae-zelandiae]